MDLDPHLGERQRQIHDLGLTGRVVNNRDPVGERRGDEEAFGAAHGWKIEGDLGAGQARRLSLDVAVRDRELRAHLLERLQVLIDRSGADGTAPRQRDPSVAEARQQRGDDQERGAHRSHEVVRGLELVDLGCVNLERRPVACHLGAGVREEL